MDIFDFPKNIRARVEDVLRRKQNEITIQDEGRIVEYSSEGAVDKQSVISIDNALSLLARIRDSYRQGGIKPAEYEKMVLKIMQNYLSQIDDSQKINFVVNGIRDSEFMSYLSDGILNKLRGSIIESISNKQ